MAKRLLESQIEGLASKPERGAVRREIKANVVDEGLKRERDDEPDGSLDRANHGERGGGDHGQGGEEARVSGKHDDLLGCRPDGRGVESITKKAGR